MAITKQQAQAMYHGGLLYHAHRNDSAGHPLKVRKAGEVKEWKRTGEWRLPVKHGLRGTGYIGTHASVSNTRDEFANPANWFQTEAEALASRVITKGV